VSEREIGAPEGTRIEVAELFFNLPARRKFLKADTAETAQVSRLVTQMALGYPTVGFVLQSGPRVVLEAPPAASLEERFYQIYGDRPDLIAVGKQAAGITVRGFVAALGEQGPVRGPQHVFVNRRMVRDRTIAHAIQQAYSVATIKERSPEVHLFLELAPDRVDVNVHPGKAEVRFLDQSLVHEVLRRAIVDALGATPAPELVLSAATLEIGGAGNVHLPLGFGPPSPAVGFASAGFGEMPSPVAGTVPTGSGIRSDPRVDTAAGREAVGTLIRPMTPLGQFRQTFIVAVDDEGLAIIDQHVAHERILFEQISEQLTSQALESQRMLQPVVLELSPGEHDTLLGHRGALERFGFEIADFGGASLQVIAVPALLDWARIDEALRAVAADLDDVAPGRGVDDVLRRMAATMACHAAVKANAPLTREKMQYLLDELRRTAHSSVCPHGRPVVLRLTRREIERNFERI
jgi:DNA mismatch repair protein MutL